MMSRGISESTVSSGDAFKSPGPEPHTYGQIAAILSESSGRPVSPASARWMCRSAETRFVRGLLTDPVLRGWLRSGASHSC
jgi:hypothetical protein